MAASEPAPGSALAANEPARPAIAALRRRIAVLEGRPPEGRDLYGAAAASAVTGPTGDAGRRDGTLPPRDVGGPDGADAGGADAAWRRGAALATGVAGFDRLFGQGGLARNALHEVVTDEVRGGGAAAGFVVALLARAAAAGVAGAVLWASDAFAAREAGGPPYGPGLAALGLDPGRLLRVEGGSVADVLWALEEGLGSGALFAVVGEVLGRPSVLDLTASRRLLLRAREGGRTAVLLRHAAAEAAPSAAAARIRVAPHPSAAAFGPGRPVWHLSVEKNRDGPVGSAVMEWDPHERAFRDPAPHPRRVAAAPVDRPAGAVVALRPPATDEPGRQGPPAVRAGAS